MSDREEDVEVLVSLQAKAFYDPWNNELIDSFFLNLFEVDAFADMHCIWQNIFCLILHTICALATSVLLDNSGSAPHAGRCQRHHQSQAERSRQVTVGVT